MFDLVGEVENKEITTNNKNTDKDKDQKEENRKRERPSSNEEQFVIDIIYGKMMEEEKKENQVPGKTQEVKRKKFGTPTPKEEVINRLSCKAAELSKFVGKTSTPRGKSRKVYRNWNTRSLR